MTILSRWLAPALLAVGFGFAAMAPTPARAQGDELVRVIVDVADVIFRSGQPYYRHDNRYRYDDRLIVVHDRYRGPIYYRQVPRAVYYRDYNRYRSGPPYGNAHGYWRDGRWWDGRRWHDRRDHREYRRWQTSNSWRDRDHDRYDRKYKYKYKNKHGRGHGRDDD
ncbi:hypothetical protein IP90_02443 [Luteimonas cucumeris]|uniref:YXWGXW repeat-containing protein n=1 Tax=Luteimonas cucumeris TaxID=985012 RepID=A0A562L2M4_9GAMM|nr:hypothetical protein [Luteimonas cucumeris]TWI01883.1 hypothetical protein IP90_02443 [Luteimonas cucumeris]